MKYLDKGNLFWVSFTAGSYAFYRKWDKKKAATFYS